MEDYSVSTSIQVPSQKPLVACIGYFDGFHIGHQNLFNATLNKAREINAKSAIISFDPDPWTLLKPELSTQHISSLDDRKKLAEDMGFDVWMSLKFDTSMAQMAPSAFIEMVQKLNIVTLVCGYDFSFGHQGFGRVSDLLAAKNDHFDVIVVDAVKYLDEKISTSRIKEALSLGQVELVSKLLGRSYGLKGEVVGGRQIGRKIGYPTANLRISQEYVVPKLGVYSGFVQIGGVNYSSMIGLGYNPTVTDDRIVSIEAHIFDFNKDIYNQEVTFIFMHYVRGEIKFNSLEELIQQLKQDELDCRALNDQDLGK